jgi:hypothetical protein
MRIVKATAFVLSIVVFSYTSAANADLVNGGFEDGLAEWTPTGTVDVVGMEDPSRDGWIWQPVPVGGVWEPLPGSTSFASLWSTGWGGDVATLSRTFDASAGDVLSFDYFFDYGDFWPNYDSARGTLKGSSVDEMVLFEYNTITDPSDPRYNTLAEFANVDWTPVVVVLPATDKYTLTFTVTDIYDPLWGPAFESILGVDNVSVVPLPGALLLGALGLGSAGSLLRRLRRGCQS